MTSLSQFSFGGEIEDILNAHTRKRPQLNEFLINFVCCCVKGFGVDAIGAKAALETAKDVSIVAIESDLLVFVCKKQPK